MTNIAHTLLAEAIDYAGLFPPAGLPMAEAVANYATYLTGPDRWALGRFVVPTARLPELAEQLAAAPPHAPWRLSVLATATDGPLLMEFEQAYAAWAVVDTLETRAASLAELAPLAPLAAPGRTVYVEVPLNPDPRPLLARVKAMGMRAKARTGGLTDAAFPPADQVMRFLTTCEDLDLAWKATAGLHHPLRGSYRFSYAADSESGTMYGFLNMMLAAAALAAGMPPAAAARRLTATDLAGLGAAELSTADLVHARSDRMVAFGSCSFSEPIGEIKELGWL